MKSDRLQHTFKLWKDFAFESAHKLNKVPVGHKCGRMHGHSYRVRIHCEGILDPDRDWVVDYGKISEVTMPLIEKLDHTILNDHLDFETTAENLAWWFMQTLKDKLPPLSGVEIFETPTTSVFCPIYGRTQGQAGTSGQG
mgnify:FL=1